MNNYNETSNIKVEKCLQVPRQWFGMALFSMLFFVVFSAQSNDEIDHININVKTLMQEGATLCHQI